MADFAEKLVAQVQASNQMAALLAQCLDHDRFKMGPILKHADRNWVFKVHVAGTPFVAKRFFGESAADTVRSMQRELSFMERRSDEKFRVMACHQIFPMQGLALLEFVKGDRVDDKLTQANSAQRDRIIKLSGRWLKWYTGHRNRMSTFGPGYWIKGLEQADKDHLTEPDDLIALSRLMDCLRIKSQALTGVPVFHAATHGDFVGRNLMFRQGTICGVDIQGESWLAVARDVARFLVWHTIHNKQATPDSPMGLDAAATAGMLSSGVLPNAEHETVFGFFAGEQLYYMCLDEKHRVSNGAKIRTAIHAYCDAWGSTPN